MTALYIGHHSQACLEEASTSYPVGSLDASPGSKAAVE